MKLILTYMFILTLLFGLFYGWALFYSYVVPYEALQGFLLMLSYGLSSMYLIDKIEPYL